MIRHGVAALAVLLITGVEAPGIVVAQQRTGASLKIVVVEGEGAVNIIQQKTAVTPLIEVRDRNDQPVAGAVVNFVVRGGRATFGGARTLTVTTNAAGRAAAAGFTPGGTGALQIGATATFQGQTAAAVTIAQTNVMTAAEAAAASSATAGGSAGGGSAAGGGSGGGGGGGLSGTTFGVVGAAAAAAAVAVSAKPEEAQPESQSEPVAAGPSQFTTEVSGAVVETFAPLTGGPGCTNIYQHQLAVTLRLDSLQGALNGTFNSALSVISIPGTCTPNDTNNNFRFSLQISGRAGGSPENLTATGTTTNPFTNVNATGQNTDDVSFNGRIVGDEITGVLTYTRRNTYRNVEGTDGTGFGTISYDVVLRKR